MAKIPVEIINLNEENDELNSAVSFANAIQDSFEYSFIDSSKGEVVSLLSFRRMYVKDAFDYLENYKKKVKDYHPFIIAVTESSLDGEKFTNLFGSHRAKSGLAIITTNNVEKTIIPEGKMAAYFLYYLARYTLSFIIPEHKNHDDTHECVFDRKINKTDIVHSMKTGAICDGCRTVLINKNTLLSQEQFNALNILFAESGEILNGDRSKGNTKPRVFIASSSEGLEIARRVQSDLSKDYFIDIWNQGTVFGLGSATIEALEATVLNYDFGIFIFSPDDELNSRGILKPVARDNVIFELGLFIGKLTRFRAFVLHPAQDKVSLPSDLAGMSTASYDTENPNLNSALGPACQSIREAINKDLRSEM